MNLTIVITIQKTRKWMWQLVAIGKEKNQHDKNQLVLRSKECWLEVGMFMHFHCHTRCNRKETEKVFQGNVLRLIFK